MPEIFESFSIHDRAQEQLKALKLLIAQGYTVLDLEGNILDKHNINDEKKPRWDYRREYIKKK